jgi:D-alanyl-D-alanine carboxypeptidase
MWKPFALTRLCTITRFYPSLIAAIWFAVPAAAAPSDAVLRSSLQRDVNQYLSARSKIEHISAISLSISLQGQPENINVTAGRTQYGGGVPVTPQHLWQTGSQTKAFTAATILQLEAEGTLAIGQTVGHWLPQYQAWKNVTIRRLLNMTSGIPDYAIASAMLADYAKNPKRSFTIAELIAYVYPGNPHAPSPTTGWNYSNTNYLLAELIIERATGHSYASEIERRFLRSNLGLNDTFFAATQYPRSVMDRMVSGYFVSHDPEGAPLAPLLGSDTRDDTVSWLRASGGIISTPEDLTRWVRALYTGPMLAPRQRAELLAPVSQKTGKPIRATSPSDPGGFGLGVAQVTRPTTGTTWFYEGETLGYRMVYVYFPRQDVVVAFGLNSLPDSNQDHSGKLIDTIYGTLHTAGRL